MPTAEDLLGLFYQAPYVNGIVLFRSGEYEGLIFKRDLERLVGQPPVDIERLLQRLHFSQVEEFLFTRDPAPHMPIPVLLLDKNESRLISYAQLRWYFHPEEFSTQKVEGIIRHMEHPLVICSLFKRILYQNQAALHLFGRDLLGKNIYPFLREWAMEEHDGLFVVYSDKGRYRLFLTTASSTDGEMLVFQFFPFPVLPNDA